MTHLLIALVNFTILLLCLGLKQRERHLVVFDLREALDLTHISVKIEIRADSYVLLDILWHDFHSCGLVLLLYRLFVLYWGAIVNLLLFDFLLLLTNDLLSLCSEIQLFWLRQESLIDFYWSDVCWGDHLFSCSLRFDLILATFLQ